MGLCHAIIASGGSTKRMQPFSEAVSRLNRECVRAMDGLALDQRRAEKDHAWLEPLEDLEPHKYSVDHLRQLLLATKRLHDRFNTRERSAA